MKKPGASQGPSASELISKRIAELGDWPGKPSAECASSSRKQTRTSLDGNVRRAIDIHEGEEVDESAFKALVRQAVALNSSGKSKPSKKAKS
jgi:hypothetical protein